MADYVLTGVCGHIGSTVAKALCGAGHRVFGLALPGEGCGMLAGLELGLTRGDVRDKASLRPLFERAARPRVIHLAGIITVASGHSRLVEEVNVLGTQNMLELASEFGAESFVFASTSDLLFPTPGGETAEYSSFDPAAYSNQYAVTKAVASNMVLAAAGSMRALCVQPTAVVGPGDYGNGPSTGLIRMYLAGRLPVSVAGGYDFVDVRDAALGMISAAERGRGGECYILSGHYLGITQALCLFAGLSGRRPPLFTLPGWVARAAAPVAELACRTFKKSTVFTPAAVEVLLGQGRFSHAKATAELGYAPRPIRQTFADTIAFLGSH